MEPGFEVASSRSAIICQNMRNDNMETNGKPKAQMAASSSVMNKHENTRLTIPSASCASPHPLSGRFWSQTNRLMTKSAKIHDTSSETRSKTQ